MHGTYLATWLMIFCFSLSNTFAQESIHSSGGIASGSEGNASYSIGQLVYYTHIGLGGSVAEGVQQAFEISTLIDVDVFEGITLMANAFPNPTSGELTLIVESSDFSSMSFQIHDGLGKLILQNPITKKETNISMLNLMPAIYFLIVKQRSMEIKSFKIIKK